MKKLFLGLCLLGLGVACHTTGANVHDSSCTGGKDCAECMKSEHCEKCNHCSEAMKAECKEGTECKEGQVCPVTGKSTN